MRALSIHTFAGGMLMGVRQAGFEVDQSYEPLDYGTKTLEARHGIQVMAKGMHDVKSWPIPDGQIDFVFGNPRCGGFSNNSMANTDGSRSKGKGADCYQSADTEELVKFGTEILEANVVAWESVQDLPNRPENRPFLDRMIETYFLPNGYQVAHVFHNAANFGCPQYRKRYFCVGYKDWLTFNLDIPNPPKRMVTVGDVLGPLLDRPTTPSEGLCSTSGGSYHGDMHRRLARIEHIYKYIPQGGSMNHMLQSKGAEWFKEHFENEKPRGPKKETLYDKAKRAKSTSPFGLPGSSTYCAARLKWDGPCPTLVGDCLTILHPLLDRTITINEVAALMGWGDIIPADPPSGTGDPGRLMARGVVPSCSEWLARGVMKSLKGEWQDGAEWKVNKDGEIWRQRSLGFFDEKTYDCTQFVPARTTTNYLPLGKAS